MFMLLMRFAMFAGAMLITADTFVRPSTEVESVDRHVFVSHWRHSDDYDMHFVGGKVRSCDVGYSAFNALKDGDEVTLTTSGVFKRCIGIARGDEVITR